MPKRPTQEIPYDPIKADLARDVAATGRQTVLPIPAHSIQPTAIVPPSVVDRGPTYPAPMRMGGAVEALRPKAAPTQPAASGSTLVTKRFVINRTEEGDLGSFLIRLQQQSAARLSLSMLVRALLNLAMQAEEKIAAELVQYHFRSPSTVDRLAMSEFEDLWQNCLGKALRRPDATIQPNRGLWQSEHPNRLGQ